MIREAFPNATPATTNAFIDTQTWNDFHKTQGSLGDLVQEMIPSLTGLTRDHANRTRIRRT